MVVNPSKSRILEISVCTMPVIQIVYYIGDDFVMVVMQTT